MFGSVDGRVESGGCVLDLKRAVREASGVPEQHQRLICNKRQCSDEQSLAERGVKQGSKVAVLVWRLTGGAGDAAAE